MAANADSAKERPHGTDKAVEDKKTPTAGPNVDVISLWKSDSKEAKAAGKSESGAKDAPSTKDAAVTKDAAASKDAAATKDAPVTYHSSTRGAAPDAGDSASPTRDKTPSADDTMDKFMAQAVRERMEAQSPAGPYTKIVQPDSQPLDSKKPTVAILDNFSDVAYPLSKDAGGYTGLTHGDVTAQAAKQAGFNTIKLDGVKNYQVDLTHADWSKPMNEIADSVQSGKLPLKRDDFVNVSLGDNVRKIQGYEVPGSGDPTFAEASKFLGMDINAQNLKDQRQNILDRLGSIAKDDKRDWMDRRVAQAALDTNGAIDRLKSMGIKVAHAAGNDGPDHFDMNFMNADLQYSEKSPSGTMSPLSADNSLATPVAVPREIRYSGANVFDPTPLAEQSGKYTLTQPIRKPDGTVEINPIASFPASKYGASLDPKAGYYFLKAHDDSYGRMPYYSPDYDELSKTTQYGKGVKGVPKLAKPANESPDAAAGAPDLQKLSPGEKFRFKVSHVSPEKDAAKHERFLANKIGYGDIQLPMDGTSFGFAASAKQLYEQWQKDHGN